MDYIDESLYPDGPAPDPETQALADWEKAEHIHRVCTAWDFDIPPEPETLKTIAGWKPVVERFPFPNLLAYHALSLLLRLPPIPAHILQLPCERIDAQEEKEDLCADCV